MSQKRIGILGGTFNPIHNGHLFLARKAMREAGLDETLFVPSYKSYMKDQSVILPPAERAAMVRLAIQDHPGFSLSMIEIEKTGNSYSYQTIAAIRERRPEAELFFITGADTVFMLEKWKRPEEIFHSAVILAAYRTGASLQELRCKISDLEKRYDARIRLISTDSVNISSTEIRNAVRRGKSIREWVPEAVAEYIGQHHFYRNRNKNG